MSATPSARFSRRRWLWPMTAVLLLAGAVLLVDRGSGRDEEVPTPSGVAESAALPVAELVTTDLIVETSLSGTVASDGVRSLVHRVAPAVEAEPVAVDPSGPEGDGAAAIGGPSGPTESAPEPEQPEAEQPEGDPEPVGAEVVTSTAPIGAVVGGGDPLYRVNDAPVVLLIGPEPAWRILETGVEGTDVAQLELNLSVLGFDPDRTVDLDGTFTAETAAMVTRWQAELGVEETGSVALGSVIFLPRPVVVSAIDAQPGSELSDGSPVLQVHEEGQRIEATASLEQRSMIELGDTAEVRLPDRTMVQATVEAIGPASAGGHEITLRPAADELTRLAVDGATVTVQLSEEVASDVLAAPAAALVRTDTAGYAVQVVAGGDVTLASVKTGATADRLVEVSGDGIESGTIVVAP